MHNIISFENLVVLLKCVPLHPRTSHSFTNTDDRSNCSSNGLSNTPRSSLSRVRVTMRCVFRFILPLSHNDSSELLSTTLSLDVPSCSSCESWAIPYSPRMTSWNFSPRLRTKKLMMGCMKLNLYTINKY